MNSKVSSDWLPSYIKATRPVLEIFRMVGYFPDSPRKFPGPQNLVQKYESHLATPKRDASGSSETYEQKYYAAWYKNRRPSFEVWRDVASLQSLVPSHCNCPQF